MEKYRQGEEPADFAHPRQPKKKIRGFVESLFYIVNNVLPSIADGDLPFRMGNEYVLEDTGRRIQSCAFTP